MEIEVMTLEQAWVSGEFRESRRRRGKAKQRWTHWKRGQQRHTADGGGDISGHRAEGNTVCRETKSNETQSYLPV